MTTRIILAIALAITSFATAPALAGNGALYSKGYQDAATRTVGKILRNPGLAGSYSFQSAQYCAPNHDEGPSAPRVYCNNAA
jgi:hypothetical protein